MHRYSQPLLNTLLKHFLAAVTEDEPSPKFNVQHTFGPGYDVSVHSSFPSESPSEAFGQTPGGLS